MREIDLLFGNPICEKLIESNELWAFDNEISVVKSNIDYFKSVVTSLAKPNQQKETYFSLVLFCISGQKFKSPKISASTYLYNRTRYPKIVISSRHLSNFYDGSKVRIKDEWLKDLGENFERDFNYEFIEVKR